MPQVFSIGLGVSNVISEYTSSLWLPDRHILRTDESIGVAHGIGKVSTSLPPEDVHTALQVNQFKAEAALLPVAVFSRSFSGILGSSDPVQIHNHPDQDLDLSPLSAHLHDQKVSANGAHHHGLRDTVRFRKHHSNDRTMHAARAHLGSCSSWDLHQSHGFLVRQCFSEHHRRLLDTCPTNARCQKLAATSTTTIGSYDGLRIGRLVGLSS